MEIEVQKLAMQQMNPRVDFLGGWWLIQWFYQVLRDQLLWKLWIDLRQLVATLPILAKHSFSWWCSYMFLHVSRMIDNAWNFDRFSTSMHGHSAAAVETIHKSGSKSNDIIGLSPIFVSRLQHYHGGRSSFSQHGFHHGSPCFPPTWKASSMDSMDLWSHPRLRHCIDSETS